MCGICGIIGRDSKEENAAVLARMLRSILHRGPDEEGSLVAPRFAAGTRRLSIIDLAGGTQPIWNETNTLGVCFNGEIYNFRELRDELIAGGHRFRTHSDTEVIVHAYEQWGTQGFARLHGMFAFVLAEMPEGPSGLVKRAILARDRFGIKPLYYAAIDGALLFASEVRALLATGLVPAQISPDAVSSYLLFGSVCEPNTLVEGVYSLPPGRFAEISPAAPPANLKSSPYWEPKFSAPASSAKPTRQRDSAVTSEVRSALDRAVQSHLIADVPVGVFLSSGLDSTAIAALAAKAHPGIHTFTVAFPDLEFSEAAEARRTAERLGTQHSELQLSGDEMVARLDEAIAAFDQPSMDGINTYFVSWAARQSGLKVALSGLGSDEIFGGYPTFRTTRSVARLASLAAVIPDSLRRVAGWTARAITRSPRGPAFEKASVAWLDPTAFPHPYFFTRGLFTPSQLASDGVVCGPQGLLWRNWLARCAREAREMDAFGAVSWLELRSYMLNTLLRDTDSMSMANSLEVRVPFLDAALVEYVLSSPEAQKVGPHGPKSLLISALGDLLPANVAGQVGKRKRTFTFPWEKWLRSPLRDRVSISLSE
ncbi:MAG TPA: asparagine synthase (glutamine-hydrolyzing), partial [Candidatus Acidoferrales bacterium]|nr:asparagine synthase (glutamine-hydrolyzing) [Candidatus Acidoferrales bacterium]